MAVCRIYIIEWKYGTNYILSTPTRMELVLRIKQISLVCFCNQLYNKSSDVHPTKCNFYRLLFQLLHSLVGQIYYQFSKSFYLSIRDSSIQFVLQIRIIKRRAAYCVDSPRTCHSSQGRSKLLKSGGARCFRAMQKGKITDQFWFNLPKNRGCTCPPGTPSSYYPGSEAQAKKRGYKFSLAAGFRPVASSSLFAFFQNLPRLTPLLFSQIRVKSTSFSLVPFDSTHCLI